MLTTSFTLRHDEFSTAVQPYAVCSELRRECIPCEIATKRLCVPVLRPHKFQPSSFWIKKCRLPPVAYCAAADNEPRRTLITASCQSVTAKCCTAAFMCITFVAGIRIATMSSAFRTELAGYEFLHLVRDEENIISGSDEAGSSGLLSTLTAIDFNVWEDNDVPHVGARKYMHMQNADRNQCNTHETYTESVQKKLKRAPIDKTHRLLCDLPKSGTKPTSDERPWMQNAEVTTPEMPVKSDDSCKIFEEASSVPFKLTVPLRIVSLRGSLPPIWLKKFSLSQSKRVRLSVEYQNSLNNIYSALHSAVRERDLKPRSIVAADLITIGDSWLPLAVSGGLIEPIKAAEQQDWFHKLSAQWQNFVRRDQSGGCKSDGFVWGVPYRWGSMVIAYKTDKFLKNNIPEIEDWPDLWRPELEGQVAMVDSPREVVGAVLKSLGASYNVQDFNHDVKGGREAVKQQFLALQKQVKVFDNVHYLKAFGSDDVCVAVGWSSDVIPAAKRMSNVRVITPKSGVSLWADLWAIPAAGSVSTKKLGSRVRGASPLIHQWFEFCLQPAQSLPFKQGVFTGGSPQFFVKVDPEKEVEDQSFRIVKGGKMGPAMDTNLIEGMPPNDCLEKSELLEPLSEKAVEEYRWLFSQVPEQQNFKQKVLKKFESPFKRLLAAAGKDS